MRNSITKKFGNIEITIGSYKGVPTHKWGNTVYKHRIVLVHKEKKISFSFYNSAFAYARGQKYLKGKDMSEALDCAISDAISYYDASSLENFIAEFGYEDYKEGRKVYKGCMDMFYKLTDDLGLSADNLFDIANYLQSELND